MKPMAMWCVEVVLTSAFGGHVRESHSLYATRETAIEFVKTRAMKTAVKKFGSADGCLIVTRCYKEGGSDKMKLYQFLGTMHGYEFLTIFAQAEILEFDIHTQENIPEHVLEMEVISCEIDLDDNYDIELTIYAD